MLHYVVFFYLFTCSFNSTCNRNNTKQKKKCIHDCFLLLLFFKSLISMKLNQNYLEMLLHFIKITFLKVLARLVVRWCG